MNIVRFLYKQAPFPFLFFLISLLAFLYLNSLSGEFVWDDESFITHNEWIKHPENAGIFFTPLYWEHYHPGTKGRYRPTRTLSFLANYFLGEFNPFGYHLLNLIFHIFNCILVFYSARIIIGNYWSALGAALIFGVHPVNAESVAWIKNRAEIFGLFFFLLSFVLTIKSDFGRQVSRGLLYSFAILSYLLALMSKETALTLPLIITIYATLLLTHSKRKNILLKSAPFWIMALSFLAFIFWGLNGKNLFLKDSSLNIFFHLYVIGKTFSTYIASLFFPFNLCADRSPPIPPKIAWSSLLAFVTIGGFALILIFKLSKSSPVTAFSFLWIVIALLPSSNLIFLSGRPLAEQRLYIPSVGIGFLVGNFLCLTKERISQKAISNFLAPLKTILSVLVIISFSLMTFKRIPVWHDKQSLWEDTVKKNPNNDRAHYNLGLIYQSQGDFESARQEFSKVVQLNPGYSEAHNSLGTAYANLNQIEKALLHYRRAIDLSPNYARAHYNLGNTLVKMGRYDEAIGAYQKAVQLNPDYIDAYANLGWVYLKRKMLNQAVKALRIALRFDPDHVLANLNLGKAYYETGSLSLAETFLRKAHTLDPLNVQALFFLGNILKDKGDFSGAKKSYQEALQVEPKFAEAHNNLGNIFQQEGKLAVAVDEYQEALKINPVYPEAHNNLASMYSLQKDFPAAMEEYEKALTLRPNYFEAQFGLAGLYFIQGNFKQALVEYKKAYRLNPDKVESCLHKALEVTVNYSLRKKVERILSLVKEKAPHNK